MVQPFILGRLISYFKADSPMSLEDGLYACSHLIGVQVVSLVFYHTNQFNIFHWGMRVRVACCTIIYRKVGASPRCPHTVVKEIQQIRGSTYIKGVLLSFIIFHTRIALFCSILAYVLSGHAISAEKVFVVTAYFNILRQSMTVFFPQGIGMTAEALVSVNRLQKFLLYDETQVAPPQHTSPPFSEDKAPSSPLYEDTITSLPHNGETVTSMPSNQDTVTSVTGNGKTPSQTGIFIKNIKAKWLPDQPDYTLNDITLDVKPGNLVAVIGPVGSGKSSLFQAILRELPVLEGNIEVAGSISYASQEPWLFAGSVRSNILFGLPMEKNRYRRVVKVCALKEDFAQLPSGDRTLVGDKGVSLSGGQRARISLARAVYKRADVYLLDDPLSAVDAHVGKHLFEDCITGFLKEKTVMLITHQIQYLTHVDHVMLLEKGSVEAFGTTTQLLASGLDFTQLLDAPEEEDKAENEVDDNASGTLLHPRQSSVRVSPMSRIFLEKGSVEAFGTTTQLLASGLDFTQLLDAPEEEDKTENEVDDNASGTLLHPRQSSVRSVASSIDDMGNYEELLGDQEMRSTGGISSHVFKSYFLAGGSVLFLFYMFLTFVFTQVFASGSDYWITYWLGNTDLQHGLEVLVNPLVTLERFGFGFLKEKTVMLITHQIQYLTHVDHVMLLEKGSVEAFGTTTQLLASGLDFTQLLDAPEEEDKAENEVDDNASGTLLHPRQSSVRSVASSIDDMGNYEELLGDQEMRSTGGISSHVFKSYFLAGGSVLFLFYMFLTFVFTQVFASGSDYWITYWVNSEEAAGSNSTNHSTAHSVISGETSELLVPASPLLFNLPLTRLDFIYLFTAITITMVILTVIRSMAYVRMCMRASMRLHNQMFDSITQATMYFFNKNPSGRILNRFSKDIGAIDELLPNILIDLFQIGLTLIGIIVVVGVVNYWLLIPTFIILVVFYVLRVYYLSTSRSVKRLEGKVVPGFDAQGRTGAGKSSLIQALFRLAINEGSIRIDSIETSSLGLHDLRARLSIIPQSNRYFRSNDIGWYMFIASNRAFGFWLDAVCLVYIALVTFSFFVTGKHFFGGDVGLAITQAIGLTGMFQWGMRQSAEFVNQMTSVERVLEYSNIEKEPPLESALEHKPPPGWPDQGRIEFNSMSLRYGPAEPPVLKNLTFTIQPREKVGIVGRTGAGKSSLIQALFRLAINEGSIRIDSIETSSLGLHDLRARLSIIPQEPVLFSGSMRKNLDPFDEYPDAVLWNALEEVELKPMVQEMAGGLNTKMSEGGTNFSVGQRQLVCLARAIIRNNRVLVMDEATANVDPQTDTFIQKTIREKFALCTVLTIAHRLNTVMDSDKVLVMDAGNLVEFDHPHVLLQNEKGIFHGMVEKAGRGTAEHLHRIAAENYKNKYFSKPTNEQPSEDKKDL
ncbi:probable multidrug resistance-associated protein lethal(2)03659 [Diaphorina citri]|uniref:Probable multidrug resistance-associated protein lethal(2)03659 n=1 Tax=Diaphorina citri TaxID=121845 RepID=A0A3Q0J0E5_DIACI|nr:probable multidrug resistance-associated protein lethal(2)03659 [Diaphorina citri]